MNDQEMDASWKEFLREMPPASREMIEIVRRARSRILERNVSFEEAALFLMEVGLKHADECPILSEAHVKQTSEMLQRRRKRCQN